MVFFGHEGESPSAELIQGSGENIDEAQREAHKVNFMVDEGLITAEQASEASAAEVDQLIDEYFTPDFHQDWRRPDHIEEKKYGQKAEDIVVELLNTLPHIQARHATEAEDHEGVKADVVFEIDGKKPPIFLQLTGMTRADAVQKKLSESHAIFVDISPYFKDLTATIFDRPQVVARVGKDILRQTIKTMGYLTEYQGLLHSLYGTLGQTGRAAV